MKSTTINERRIRFDLFAFVASFTVLWMAIVGQSVLFALVTILFFASSWCVMLSILCVVMITKHIRDESYPINKKRSNLIGLFMFPLDGAFSYVFLWAYNPTLANISVLSGIAIFTLVVFAYDCALLVKQVKNNDSLAKTTV